MFRGQKKSSRKIGGTIGALSRAIGQDVRGFYIDGYSHEQLLAVAKGKMTLAEMRRQGPENGGVNTEAITKRMLKQ